MKTKETHRVWKAEWRKKNHKQYREKANAYMRYYSKTEKGREILRKSITKTRQRRKLYTIVFFGGKCVRCGFDDIRALHLDHIHGRKGDKRLGNVDSRYSFIKKYPEKAREIYQLLCANCNCIKVVENHEYFKAN